MRLSGNPRQAESLLYLGECQPRLQELWRLVEAETFRSVAPEGLALRSLETRYCPELGNRG
jgi:hypothetical protein